MVAITLSTGLTAAALLTTVHATCDTPANGYQCNTGISHNWGQYSPYFSVPSEISASVPSGCKITFANVLSRHGARNPTASKTTKYAALIAQIHKQTTKYSKAYSFIQNYTYSLGSDTLTPFGEQEMINSGIKFYNRYKTLARKNVPFVRSSSDQRVVESAQNFTQGFYNTCVADKSCSIADDYPDFDGSAGDLVLITEAAGQNDTLDSDTCYNYASGYYSTTQAAALAQWEAVFIPTLQSRINANLVGANLTVAQTVYFMDLCPFITVQTGATLSPFCALFSKAEWEQYNYLESLNKFYGDAQGNHLGPSQGVGFANELLSRMTASRWYAGQDETTVNHTLDSSNTTFPLNRALYADFSHDDPMTSIFAALGLYNATANLSNTTLMTTTQTNGYSAAYTVPFGGRAYFEKMLCTDDMEEEYVRVLVNDRVIPLQNCGADDLGRCTLADWIASLGFVTGGGLWGECGN